MMLIATVDYAYQFWKTNRDLMMTKEEVKDESKSSERNADVKGQQRRRRARSYRAKDVNGCAESRRDYHESDSLGDGFTL